jgi:LPXTG-motif cell wall-anchored protein
MTVNETVHYVDQDGNSIKGDSTAEMILTPQGYHDNQTGKDVITGWKSNLTNSEFPTHKTQVDGYDVDMTKTAATDVSANHSEVNPVKISVGKDNKKPSDVEITVHYQKKSSVKINYVDVNGLDQDHYQDGKVIENGQHDISLAGHKGDAVFNNGATPWDFTKDGWKLVKETSPVTSDLTLGDQPREITVYLIHGQTTTKPQEAKEIITETSQTRTINYYDDKTGNPQTGYGSLAGKGAKSITQKLNWKRTPVYDLVDGHLLGFAQLDKDGHPMMSPFGMFLLLPTGDENDPASWTPVSLEQDGKKQPWDKNEFPAVESPDLTKHGYQKDQSKKQHADDKQGQLVEAAAADPSKGNQTQNIFYVHDQTPVTPADEPTYPANAQDKKLTKVTQTRTIHYLDDVSGEKIHDDVVQTITWSRTPVYDAVDGSFIGYAGKDGKVDPALNDENSWVVTSTDSNYPAVKSPAVTDYAKTPSLIRHTADGSGQEVLAADGVPSADDIVVNVYYFHDTEEVTETKTVSETIHYVYKDSGKPAAADKTVKLSFSRSGQTDKVTGKTTWGEWTPNQDFASVTSPTISGYTPDQRMIDAQTVGHDSQDLDFTVYYSKDTVTTPGEDQPTTPETPSPKTYTWTIEYVDENGNKIIPDVQDPTAFHDGDQFDGAKSGYDKATISKDGQTYELVASKHASGSIAGGDVTTTYVYKLVTSEEPGEPATPEKPGKPDTPVVPDQPSQPGDGEPAQPSQPGETPGDKPEEPTHPGTPEEPVTPTTPDTPGDETPSKPAGPSEPDQPGTPNQPGEPTIPDVPATPETPTTPDQPSTAEPGQPAEPGTPGEDVPATPETPVTPTTPSEPDQPSTPVHDGRYMLTIRYQDEDGNKLQPSVTDSNKYQAGEAFNAAAFEQAEITKDGKTYQLVPAKSFNTTGEFSDHSELTIYVYREKGAAPKTPLKLTIKYLDEFGNEIAETVNGGDAFKNGQNFNSNGHLKTTITTADGKVYKLIAKKIYNAVGTFDDSDETTVFIYQLVADGNATSAEPAMPGTPADEPSQPTNPVTPAEPTGPSTPADSASPAQSTTAGSSASATPVADGQAKATSAASPAVTKTVADASQSTPAQATAAKQLPQTGNANAKAVMALGIGSLIGALAAGLGLGKKRR